MSTERLYKLFQGHIEATMNTGEMLLPDLEEAAAMIVESFLNDGKILTCGNGTSASLAQIFTRKLLHRYERERPSLPAINLGSSLPNVASVLSETNLNDVFAKEIRAYAQPNDVLLLITSSGNPQNLIQAMQTAHSKGIKSIILTGRDGGNIASLMDEGDKEIRIPSASRARIHEIHLLILFCLCDLIDEQLFGPLDP